MGKAMWIAAVLGLAVVWIPSTAMADPNVPLGYTVESYVSGIPNARNPIALAFSSDGVFGRPTELYVCFSDNASGGFSPTLYRIPGKGEANYFAAASDRLSMDFPGNAAFGTYLYGTSYIAGGVVRYDANGKETFFASVSGGGVYGAGFAPGGRWGTGFYAMEESGSIQRFESNGSRTYLTTGLPVNDKGLNFSFSLGGAWGDYLYVGVAPGPSKVLRVDPNGVQTTFVSSGLGSNYLLSLAFDETGSFGGDLFVSSLDNKIFRVKSDGSVSVFATGFNFGAGNTSTGDILFGPDGTMYVADGGASTVWHIVPEPASLILLAGGGLALLRRRRR